VRTSKPRLLALAFLALSLAAPRQARAYRPFDGTDADVADVGEFELELGPSHFYAQGKQRYLITPAVVLNLGFAKNFELVIDSKQLTPLETAGAPSRLALVDDDVFIKWVVRRGALQGERGISIAVEGGPLLPEVNGEHGFGAQADTIFSFEWSGGRAHFNEQIGWSRLGHPEIMSGLILEGTHEFPVRPVGELLVDDEIGERLILSALVGGIWTASETLSFDLGFRVARVEDERAAEIRAGLTWAVPLWEASDPGKGATLRHGRPRYRFATR
jgi:hypothetical protein